MKLKNVAFPGPQGSVASPSLLWDISIVDGVVESIEPAAEESRDIRMENGVASHLLLPSLCHPHLHLDKAYLLTCCGGSSTESARASTGQHPSYSDLLPQTGSFAEALQTTAVAKSRFTAADLYRRGMQLLATSYAQGVTTARVFVEVDAQAAGQGTVAVAVAAELQALWRGSLDLQVCAFAQEVLFTGDAGTANRAAMEAVLENQRRASASDSDSDGQDTISVLGVTPYVEASRELALQNIDWAVTTARHYGLHLDFHLDYNLSDSEEPLIFALLASLLRHGWPRPPEQHARRLTVVVGHATQLTRLPPARLQHLADIIRTHDLPVYIVGLPTSDLYMMGRQPAVVSPSPDIAASSSSPPSSFSSPVRGTLAVPALIKDYGLRACLGVNNVGNAFTPYGTGDPLQLACWGVGLYHAGTGLDAQLLYGSVSWRAREAIGGGATENGENGAVDWEHLETLEDPLSLAGKYIGPVLAISNRQHIGLPASVVAAAAAAKKTHALQIPTRPRLGFRDVVWDPPEVSLRQVVSS